MFKEIRIHLIAIAIFFGVTAIFNAPVFSGKTIEQNDIKQYQGSASEVTKYREGEDRQILWTNVMFSGMPTYMISAVYGGEILKKIPLAITGLLSTALAYPILLMLGFYILSLSLKVDPLIAIVGALAYGFSSYFMIVMEAGHNSKVHAMAYLPGILAGMIWAYRQRKLLIGAATFTLFMGLELAARHPQMFYYFLFLAIPYGVWELFQAIKDKQLPQFIKGTVFLLLGAFIAFGSNLPYLGNAYQYGKHTIRGKSELTHNQSNRTEGLDRDYVTNWSYGIDESWTLLVPNFKGGPTGQIGPDNKALDGINGQFKQAIAQQNAYFGDQPFTGGPVYAGAIVVLLAFLAFFFSKGSLRYVLLGVFFLTMALAWGKNWQGLTDFFLDHVPFYDKFRAVASMMVIPEFILPLLAILALSGISSIAEKEWSSKMKLLIGGMQSKSKVLLGGIGIMVLFLGLNYISPGILNDFLSDREAETLPGMLNNAGLNQAQANDFIFSLEEARISIFKADVLRSLLFVLLGGVLLFLYQRGALKKKYLLVGMMALVVLDLFPVNKRYLNKENFIDKDRLEKNYGVQPSPADQAIMQQYTTDPYFRTLNLAVSTFNDASTSFFHYSLGGYHGAKLKIYQELIEGQLGNDIEKFRTAINNRSFSPALFDQLPALNMLNTRYIIINPNSAPVENPGRLGNAWLVNSIKTVSSADEEIASLSGLNPKTTAVMRNEFAEKAGKAGPGLGSINLSSYDPEELVYEYNAESENLAVFSEIWYPENWIATIDGEETDILRANYVLRALKVPAGKHTISLKYVDKTSTLANTIALICSLLALIAVPLALFWDKKKATA